MLRMAGRAALSAATLSIVPLLLSVATPGLALGGSRAPTDRGTRADDRLKGTSARDVIGAGFGDDRIVGLRLGDHLYGGPGHDRLRGGPGADRLMGGAGNDVIQARDGGRDVVRCGPGHGDRARVDFRDRVFGCEHLSRRSAGGHGSARAAGPPERFFSDLSPWNTPIDHSRVDPNSATMIHKLVADGRPAVSSTNIRQQWGTPLYFGRASDPLYRLRFTGGGDFTREIDGTSIHVPPGARPSAGSDAVIWVSDQTDGYTYVLQRASVSDSTRTITAWKGYRLATEGLGFRYPDGPPTGVQPIRPEELAAGYVGHAMSMGAKCLSGHTVAPFDHSATVGNTCSGDTSPATTRLSMGNVVFLDMSHAQIDALGEPKWEEAILKGLADYGAVVGLNGGAAWALKFENPLDRTSLGRPDPYAAAGLPDKLDFSHALDDVGGWGANLKVLAPFPWPCSGICD